MRNYLNKYQERKAAGLCVKCGAKARQRRVTCTKCAKRDADRYAERYAEKRAARYAEHKAAHVCTHCNNAVVLGRSYCDSCAKQRSEWSAKLRNLRKTEDQCSRCGAVTIDGKVTCAKCAEKRTNRYIKKSGAGLCARCKNKAALGRTLCNKCATRTAKNGRNQYGTRKELMVCVRCRGEVTDGKTQCIKCTISTNIRNRVRAALIAKSDCTFELVGCTVDELRDHLEAQFQPGMTWENYGEWHVDHILPMSIFDFEDPAQQRAGCHYTNLQPLWAADNLAKGNKILA